MSECCKKLLKGGIHVQQTNTIQGTYERAKIDNLGISKNFIRQSCLDGKLKHCRAGSKILIFYPNLLELLQNGDTVAERPQQPSIIRKLPEKILYERGR